MRDMDAYLDACERQRRMDGPTCDPLQAELAVKCGRL